MNFRNDHRKCGREQICNSYQGYYALNKTVQLTSNQGAFELQSTPLKTEPFPEKPLICVD